MQIGQYVGRDALLLRVWSAVDVPDSARELLRNAFDLGRYRSVAQDPSFGFEQMTDVAVKALSPGINDPISQPTPRQSALYQVHRTPRLREARGS